LIRSALTVAESDRRVRRPRWRAAGIASVLVIAGGGFLWWKVSAPRQAPLGRDWPARVVTIAGDGVIGIRDGDADRARFADPFGVAVRSDGVVFVTDGGQSPAVRGISPDGRVYTVAGGMRGFADGVGVEARFDTPSGVAIDASGVLYVADTGNHAIRRIGTDGTVTTIAGDGTPGYRDGPPGQARFNGPIGIAVDGRSRIIVADTYNDRIRAISPQGDVTTIGGDGVPGADDGVASQARFDTPGGVSVDASGTVYVADTGNGLVRLITPANGVTTVTAGLPDGLVRPVGISASESGDLYVTDDRGRVVELHADGAARILAGSTGGFRDGSGTEAQFRRPAGVAQVSPGRLIVCDTGNALIRLVAAQSLLEWRAPPSPRISPRFDDEAFGAVPILWPVSPMDGPHEIAGTVGEARGGQGGERFHAGIDVRVDEGTLVRAVRDGTVSAPVSTNDFDSLNEWLRIGPVSYVHMRAGRWRDNTLTDDSTFVATYDETGKLTRVRVRRGARFVAGDVIGSVNRFNHVHLNVGWPGEERNPLVFRLTQFADTRPPSIARAGVRVFDEAWEPLNRRVKRRVQVAGRLRIVVDAWDQADGNRPNRRLGLFALGYQVLDRTGSPVAGFETPVETIRFDRLSTQADAARLVYAPGSGIPFYSGGRTRFLYVVTNTMRHGIAAEGFWDTTALAPGDYTLRILAEDVRGNTATANRDLPVTVVRP
jgi:sugar lactone lactonase YvrE